MKTEFCIGDRVRVLRNNCNARQIGSYNTKNIIFLVPGDIITISGIDNDSDCIFVDYEIGKGYINSIKAADVELVVDGKCTCNFCDREVYGCTCGRILSG